MRKGLGLFRALGEHPNVPAVLASVGEVALEEQDHATAWAASVSAWSSTTRWGAFAASALRSHAWPVWLLPRASTYAPRDWQVPPRLWARRRVAFEVFGQRATDARLAPARRSLGQAAAAAAWAAKQTMGPDEVVRYALATREGPGCSSSN